jgi:hypothetical protein
LIHGIGKTYLSNPHFNLVAEQVPS